MDKDKLKKSSLSVKENFKMGEFIIRILKTSGFNKTSRISHIFMNFIFPKSFIPSYMHTAISLSCAI